MLNKGLRGIVFDDDWVSDDETPPKENWPDFNSGFSSPLIRLLDFGDFGVLEMLSNIDVPGADMLLP